MSGLIQRLLDRGGPSLPAAPASGISMASNAARSLSPMAEHDQRLQDPAFRGLMGMVPTAPYAAAPEVMPEEAAAPVPVVMRPSRRPVFQRPARPKPPHPAPMLYTESESTSEVRSSSTAAFDPIAALRRAATEAPPRARPEPSSEARPGVARTPSPERAEPGPVLPETEAVRPAPTRDAPAMSTGEPVQPPISNRLPTDPPAIDALPPKLPTPEPLPTIVTPLRTFEPESNTAVQPAPSAEVSASEPRPVRPVSPRPAVAPAPTVEKAPAFAEPVPERIIERIIREVEPAPAPEQQQPRPRVTANSVSKIGALPERRRAHTLFGLRRG